MTNEPKQFSDKYNLLSPEAQFYFNNEFSGKIILNLADKYKIDANYIYDLVFDTVNNNFDFDYVYGEASALNIFSLKLNVFFKDFIGEIFLPISFYIKDVDIRGALIKRGGDAELYQDNVNKFLELIEDENFKNLDKLVELHEKVVDPKEEEEYVSDLLSNHLLEVLEADSQEAAASLSGGLIYLLNNNENFKIKAPQILLENNSLLSSGNIILADKEVSPTVSNWLKDFIKINGSDMFDELKMAQYLSTSPNAKKLTRTEKDLLRKLLKLYRNLAFFPDSMENNPIEDWQIIPVDKPETDKKVRGSEIFHDVLNDDKRVDALKVAAKAPQPREQIQEKIENAPLNELERMLTQYAPGSLEYKAVRQEIEHLKKKK